MRERFSDKWQVLKLKKKKRWAGFPMFLEDAVLQLTAGRSGWMRPWSQLRGASGTMSSSDGDINKA